MNNLEQIVGADCNLIVMRKLVTVGFGGDGRRRTELFLIIGVD